MFGPYSDYLIPLLKVLDNFPNKMGRGEAILAKFEEQYHQEIPEDAYRLEAKSGKMYWVRCVYNIQGKARENGLIENPKRGLWQLTENGHQWLKEHPNSTHFTGKGIHKSAIKSVASSRLMKVKSSPFDTKIDTDNHNRIIILDREIENIRKYLNGKLASSPSAEKLCDWIYFCYTFVMYSEGRDIFATIDSNDVHLWYYERTKKLARMCEIRS